MEAAKNMHHTYDKHLTGEPTFTLENLKRIYLFIYNVWQLIGFLYIVVILSLKYFKDGSGNFLNLSFNIYHM